VLVKQYKKSYWPQAKPDKPEFGELLTELGSTGFLQTPIKIEACAVWDTVSAIGIPLPGSMPPLNAELSSSVAQSFPKNLHHAFHAIALNEERAHFNVVLWLPPPQEGTQTLKQCWFVGSHSDVGGGSRDQTLSTIPFLWMVSQLQHFSGLSFNTTTLQTMLPENSLIHTSRQMSFSPTAFGFSSVAVTREVHEVKFARLGKNCSSA